MSTNRILTDDNFYPMFFDMEFFIKELKILNGQDNSYASDVYSFSMIAYELITGEKPLIPKGQKRPNLLNIKIESIRTFISKCWSENPEERQSFCQIFEILMTEDFRKYFNANEEEVTKYLNLFDDEIKNPNLL